MRRIVYDNLSDDGDKGWWRRWLLSYRVLIVEDTDLGEEGGKAVLRERDFRFALLSRSDLHRADLAWADVRAAQLWKTLAKGKMKDAQLQGAFLRDAQLQGVQLNSAKLQGADLRGAQLQGAELNYANLQGADLQGALLQGADLSYANLQGADLRGAQLQGAKLEGVQLQGADLAGRALARRCASRPRQAIACAARLDRSRHVAAHAGGQGAIQAGSQRRASPIRRCSPLVMSRLDEILRDEPPDWDGQWLVGLCRHGEQTILHRACALSCRLRPGPAE